MSIAIIYFFNIETHDVYSLAKCLDDQKLSDLKPKSEKTEQNEFEEKRKIQSCVYNTYIIYICTLYNLIHIS